MDEQDERGGSTIVALVTVLGGLAFVAVLIASGLGAWTAVLQILLYFFYIAGGAIVLMIVLAIVKGVRNANDGEA